MPKFLVFISAILLVSLQISCISTPEVAMIDGVGRKPSNLGESEEVLKRYLNRSDAKEVARLRCTSFDSQAVVVFHNKDGSKQPSDVSIYGIVGSYDIWIPFFNGEKSIAQNTNFLNALGEVTKEFENAQILNQQFELNSDKKTLTLRVMEDGWFSDTTKASSVLECQ